MYTFQLCIDYVDAIDLSSIKGVYNHNTVGNNGDFHARYATTPCPKKGSHQTFANNFLKS